MKKKNNFMQAIANFSMLTVLLFNTALAPVTAVAETVGSSDAKTEQSSTKADTEQTSEQSNDAKVEDSTSTDTKTSEEDIKSDDTYILRKDLYFENVQYHTL